MRGLGKDEFPEMLVKAAEEAEERCLPILEEKAAQGQTEGAGDVLGPTSVNMPLELMEDWDFMVSKEAPRQTCPSLTIYIRYPMACSMSATRSPWAGCSMTKLHKGRHFGDEELRP